MKIKISTSVRVSRFFYNFSEDYEQSFLLQATLRYDTIYLSRVVATVLKVKKRSTDCASVAGETRLEHATGGFGDRCSTN